MSQPGLPFPAPPPTADERNWRGPRSRVVQLWKARQAQRWSSLALLLVLLGALGWLLYKPFAHPQTQFVFLGAGEYLAPEITPLAFAAEDYASFKLLTDGLGTGRGDGLHALNSLARRDAMARLPQELAALDLVETDVLLTYVSAHGVSEDGIAFLLCGNFDPANPTLGRARLRDLLTQLAQSPAGVKLLILDAGQFAYAPRMGLLANEFPRLLAQEVARLGDRGLWVLASTSGLERSQLAPAIDRSLFGYYVARGLAGGADLDDNQLVDVGELARYVARNVAATVSETSGGHRDQRPRLLWGGGEIDDQTLRPTLISVSRFADLAESQNLAALVKESRAASREGRFLAVKPKQSRRQKLAGAVGGVLSGDSVDLDTLGELGERDPREALHLARLGLAEGGEAAGGAGAAGDRSASGGEATKDAASAATPTLPSPAEGGSAAAPSAAEKPTPTSGGATAPEAAPAKAEAAPMTKAKATAGSAAEAAPLTKPKAADANTTSGQPPAGAANAASASSEDGTAASAAAQDVKLSRLDVPQLLAFAWRLRDRLANGDTPCGAPCEDIPELWRDFELRLLDFEGDYRSGRMVDPQALARRLREVIDAWRFWPNPPLEEVGEKSPAIARRLAASRHREMSRSTPSVSLAWARFAAAHGGPAPPAAAVLADERLQAIEQRGTAAELLTWARALPPECDRYSEFRWARRLALESSAPWPIVSLAISTRRLADAMCLTCPAALPWIQAAVAEADAARLAAERRLLDDTGLGDLPALERSLRHAADGYREAQNAGRIVASARRNCHAAICKAPSYLRWRRLAGPEAKFPTPRDGDLMDYFTTISRLSAEFAAPPSAKPAELDRLRSELATIEDALDQGLQEIVLAEILTSPTEPGDAGALELRLATPLLAWSARGRLLAAAADVDGQLLARLRLEPVPAILPDDPRETAALWTALASQAKLEAALARLAVGEPREDAQWMALARSLEKVSGHVPGAAASAVSRTRWDAQRAFGLALQEFYRSLPGRIQSAAARYAEAGPLESAATRPDDVAIIERTRRLLWPSDLAGLDERAIVAPGRITQTLAQIEWQANRLRLARLDARPDEADELAHSLALLDHQATALPGGAAAKPKPAADMRVDGPTRLDLTTDAWTPVNVTLRLEGTGSLDAWALIDFDPELVDVLLSPDIQVFTQRDLESLWGGYLASPRGAAANRYPLDPAKLGLAPSLTLAAGVPRRLAFKAKAKAAAPRLGKLIVKLVGGGAFVRHEIELTPPPAELVQLQVDGIPGSFVPALDGAVLSTFPNRPTHYQLRLLNVTRQSRLMRIDLWDDTRPEALLPLRPLPAGEAQSLLARWRGAASLASLADVSLPPGEPLPIPFPKPDKADAKLNAPLTTGMLLVASDRQTGLTTIKRLRIAPQRPRRFLQARARYDAGRQRIEIDVRPQERSLLPPEGVVVRAVISPPPPRVAQTQLDGDIKAPDFEAHLYAQIPVESDREYEVRISVDNYPRAFVFRVATSGAASDSAAQADTLAMRWIAPPSGSAFAGPGGSIPVEFQVDAPAGAFSGPGDFVEVGLDVNRDRELTGEPAIQLAADRQVTVSLDQLAPEGHLTLTTLMRDFKLDLPAGMLRAKRVNLLGRVHVGARDAWSAPVEIVLDGLGPRIARIEIRPAFGVPVKGELDVQITTHDDALSGVAAVEAAIDVDGGGKFSEENKPLAAKLLAGRRWTVKVPTGDLPPGQYNLIARARDQVGNLGGFARARFDVLTPEALAARQLNQLGGMVTYSKAEAPQAGAEVILKPAKMGEPAPPPTRSNAQGEFVFIKVPPGKYTLQAELLIAGKTRKAEAPVDVAAAPAKIEPVRLNLK